MTEIEYLKQENKKLKEVTNEAVIEHEKLIAKVNKLKQALEEIRETIKEYESKEWNNFNDMDAKLEKISEILDEVLNDN